MENVIYGAHPNQFGSSGSLKDKVLFCCDLSGVSFYGGHLEHVVLFGCDLTGADFSGAIIDDLRFLNCYSAQMPPVDFTKAQAVRITNIGSSISATGALSSNFVPRWPVKADALAGRLRTARNDVRYQTIKEIVDDHAVSELLYPFLGTSLLDPEWEVRLAGLEALVSIGVGSALFVAFDTWMKEWMLRRLGDPSAFVRAAATRLLPVIAPSEAQLQRTVTGFVDDPIGTMRACYTLLQLHNRYSELIDFDSVRQLVTGIAPVEARILAMDILEAANDHSLRTILPTLASDPEPKVRARTLSALGIISVPDVKRLMQSAMQDTDWQVRLQALDTAEELGCLDPAMIDAALHDPSEQIREFAKGKRGS